jgi:hypothetical protein
MHALVLVTALAGAPPEQASAVPAYYGYSQPYFAPRPRRRLDFEFDLRLRLQRRPRPVLRFDVPYRVPYSAPLISPYALPRGGYSVPYCGPDGCWR